jgi:Tol biopolymer transport system component
MNADGSGQRRLAGTIGKEPTPVWSPDGRKIAFARQRAGGGIYIMNADGSGLRQLTRNQRGSEDWIPIWAPPQTK